MQTPYFFGYGSLVNRSTHAYPDAERATLQGWGRAWVRSKRRDDLVYLSAVMDPDARIDGLIATVPGSDWGALDTREAGYARRDATAQVRPQVHDVAVYAVNPTDMHTNGDHRILLSYLDTVVQGFHTEFGAPGVADFFATTRGWNTPILDDRAAPIYPRAQTLTRAQTALVDQHLTAVGSTVAP